MVPRLVVLWCCLGLLVGSAQEPDPITPRTGGLTASIDELRPGLRPRVRVTISNPAPPTFQVPAQWTLVMACLSDDGQAPVTVSEIRRSLSVLSPGRQLGIRPYRAQGLDVELDLRPAIGQGVVVLYRIEIAPDLSTAPRRAELPRRLEAPLVLCGESVPRTDSDHFQRHFPMMSLKSTVSGRCRDGGSRWTRRFDVDPSDPLFPVMPALLIDGVSHRLLPDGVFRRLAIEGLTGDGQVHVDACIVAVVADE